MVNLPQTLTTARELAQWIGLVVQDAIQTSQFDRLSDVFLGVDEFLKNNPAWNLSYIRLFEDMAEATGCGIALDPHHAGAGDGIPDVLLTHFQELNHQIDKDETLKQTWKSVTPRVKSYRSVIFENLACFPKIARRTIEADIAHKP